MSQQRIRAVIFDLGETLLNFGKVSTTGLFRQGARTSHAFLKGLGQPVAAFEVYCWTSLIRLRIRSLISSLTGRDFDAFAMLQRFGQRQGIKLSGEQWREYAWRWYEPLARLGRIESDLAQTLSKLRDLGLKLGILSNTFINSHSLDRHLREMGILDFFDFRMYSYEHRYRKPHVSIFRLAAERIGETVENIAFVGDRIDKDVRPAIASGMVAVMKDAYTNAGKTPPRGTLKIGRIAELPALIEAINAEANGRMSR
jgi:HAD superfamily hydrolase (TIGR01549 family)